MFNSLNRSRKEEEMRNQYSFIAVWVLAFLAIFLAGILFTHIVYTLAMKDLVVRENTGITTLKVKEVPKGFIQNLQVYDEQPATTPIGKEL
jgi:paraquat-inducible protein B